MATIKAIVRTSKRNAEVHVRFRLSDGRNVQLFHSSEIKVQVDAWDSKNDCIKARAVFNEQQRNEINSSVIARKQLLLELYNAYKDKSELTSETLERLVDEKLHPEKYQKSETNFYDLIELYLERRKLYSGFKINRTIILGVKKVGCNVKTLHFFLSQLVCSCGGLSDKKSQEYLFDNQRLTYAYLHCLKVRDNV